jgi:hypothetical protein
MSALAIYHSLRRRIDRHYLKVSDDKCVWIYQPE